LEFQNLNNLICISSSSFSFPSLHSYHHQFSSLVTFHSSPSIISCPLSLPPQLFSSISPTLPISFILTLQRSVILTTMMKISSSNKLSYVSFQFLRIYLIVVLGKVYLSIYFYVQKHILDDEGILLFLIDKLAERQRMKQFSLSLFNIFRSAESFLPQLLSLLALTVRHSDSSTLLRTDCLCTNLMAKYINDIVEPSFFYLRDNIGAIFKDLFVEDSPSSPNSVVITPPVPRANHLSFHPATSTSLNFASPQLNSQSSSTPNTPNISISTPPICPPFILNNTPQQPHSNLTSLKNETHHTPKSTPSIAISPVSPPSDHPPNSPASPISPVPPFSATTSILSPRLRSLSPCPPPLPPLPSLPQSDEFSPPSRLNDKDLALLRMGKPSQAKTPRTSNEIVLEIIKRFVNIIFSHPERVPPPLRLLLHTLHHEAQHCGFEAPDVAVGGFLVLRIISPCIANPSQCGLPILPLHVMKGFVLI
jgi:hypothetical protein